MEHGANMEQNGYNKFGITNSFLKYKLKLKFKFNKFILMVFPLKFKI